MNQTLSNALIPVHMFFLEHENLNTKQSEKSLEKFYFFLHNERITTLQVVKTNFVSQLANDIT